MSIQFYNIVKILDLILFKIKKKFTFNFCSKLFLRLILKKITGPVKI